VAGGLGLGLILAHGVKLVCWRARPEFPVGGVQLDSFPSSHTASIAFCVAAALHLVAMRAHRDDRWWYATAVVGAILTAAVAFARVYLQRHWATDVSASLLMAIAFWGSVSSARVPRLWLGLTLGLGLLALGGVHTVLPSAASTSRTRPPEIDASARAARRALRGSSANRL
jgi:membrane-associated phospholipid phosphatase